MTAKKEDVEQIMETLQKLMKQNTQSFDYLSGTFISMERVHGYSIPVGKLPLDCELQSIILQNQKRVIWIGLTFKTFQNPPFRIILNLHIMLA